jgi:hypothetical protein
MAGNLPLRHRTDHVEATGREGNADLDLLVIVPRDLPSRAAILNETLAGTAIRVVVDRRRGDRRHVHQSVAVERRHGDRRAAPRVVAWVYACPVVAVGTPRTTGTPAGPLATGSTPNPGRAGTAPGSTGPRGYRSLVSAAHSVSRSPRLFPVPLIGLLPWLTFRGHDG